MDEIYTNVIQLNVALGIGLLLLCMVLILKGRSEIATGFYMASTSWCIVFKIGNIAQTWFLLATMYCAAFVFYNKNDFYFPNNNRWIIPWLSLWWLWSLALLLLSDIPGNRSMAQTFILNSILPIPVVLGYSQSIKKIKSFSITYILTTIIGGIIFLQYANTNFPELVINPLTGTYGMGRLPIRNYHSFAYPYGTSIIFLIALMQLSKNFVARVVCIFAMVYCLYFLYFSCSRQAILSTLAVCTAFLYWLLRNAYMGRNCSGYKTKTRLLFLLTIGVFAACFLYTQAPVVVVRQSETIAGAFSTIGDETRIPIWSEAMLRIWDSHFLGTAYDAGNVHNYFLSVLANEGILGFILMLGFLLFSLKQMRNTWTSDEISNIPIWRIAFFCVFFSALIHSQFSGDNVSTPELFWSIVFLWYSSKHLKQIRQTDENSHTNYSRFTKAF